MDTKTIDQLFLELSQVTKAETKKEIRLKASLLKAIELIQELTKIPEFDDDGAARRKALKFLESNLIAP